ncbi:MAG: hypothetical protein IT292_09380 [Deltaproteobacteria bacterium]|nr:hypothetical protein [Deltaproteobacteria bacterium]
MKNRNNHLNFTLFIVCLFVAISCKGKLGSSGGVEQADNLSKTLIGYLPKNTLAFHYWDFSLPGYQKYKNSNWHKAATPTSFVEGWNVTGNELIATLPEILKQNGVTLEDKLVIENLFSEGAAYLLGQSDNAKATEIEYGVVVKARDEQKLAGLTKSIKDYALQKQLQPLDMQIDGGQGFSIAIKDKYDPKQVVDVFIGQKKNLAAIASKKETLIQILATTTPSSPVITTEDKYKKAVRSIPGFDQLYGFGYADIEQLSNLLSSVNQVNQDIINTLKNQPLISLVYAWAMNDHPYSEAVLNIKPDADSASLPRQFKQSSSESLLQMYGAAPSLLLSLDGQTVHNLLATAANANSQTPVPAMALTTIKDIERLSILAKVNTAGQSFLPIPDLVIAVQTAKGEELQTTLKSTIAPFMSLAAGNTSWQTKQINGTTVTYNNTPLNLGVYLASTKGHLLVTSSETQMNTILGAGGKSAQSLATLLPAKAQDALALKQSIMSFYLDFNDLATALQNAQGMMQMSGNQNDALSKALEPKQLEMLRKLGRLSASLKLEDNVLRFQTAYAPGSAQQ